MKHLLPTVEDLPWLDASGPDALMVICTRVRLARNLLEYGFHTGNEDLARLQAAHAVSAAVEDIVPFTGAEMLRLSELSPTERLLLQERQLISRELVASGPGSSRSEAILLGGDASVMVNEEDHLRIQGLHSGFALEAAYQAADRMDTLLGGRLCFAFHPEFGYLTSCPSNVGTGLRASVLIHLPGLMHTGELTRVLDGLGQLGMTSRGWRGEGSEMLGHLVQVSNQTTLGWSEADLLNHLQRLVRQVIECEARAREVMWRDAPAVLEDRIWRALGVLRHARRLSVMEALDLLSAVRLGVGAGVFLGIELSMLNRLVVRVQTAHVAEQAGTGVDDTTLTSRRAAMVRQMLGERGVHG